MTGQPGIAGATVLVAGASRGIGAAVAVALARAGAARLVLLARDADRLGTVAAEVRAQGAEADTIAIDLTTVAAGDAVDAAGPADVFVYCAGSNRPQPFLDVSESTFDALFALNVRAGYFLAQRVARRMRSTSTPGRIVFVSSQMGHVGAPERTVYCATKHAIEGLVKSMALDLAGDGIRVVSVAPTFVRTEMTAAQLDDPAVGEQLLRQIPLGRWATPEDVAGAVVWAASDAASMLTGTSLVLDGGWTAG